MRGITREINRSCMNETYLFSIIKHTYEKRCLSRPATEDCNCKTEKNILLYGLVANVGIVATIRVAEPSVLVFLAFISKTVNNQCYNPYIFGKILSRSFQKYMVCSIVCLPI